MKVFYKSCQCRLMILWIICLGFLSSGVVFGQPAESTATPAGPKIVFETPVYNFGKAISGDVIKYTYVFTNEGTAAGAAGWR